MPKANPTQTIFLFDTEVLRKVDQRRVEPYAETALYFLAPAVAAVCGTTGDRVQVRDQLVRPGSFLWELLGEKDPGVSGIIQPEAIRIARAEHALYAVVIEPFPRAGLQALLTPNEDGELPTPEGFLGWFDMDEPLPAGFELYAWAEGERLMLEKTSVARYLRRRRPWADLDFAVRWEERQSSR